MFHRKISSRIEAVTEELLKGKSERGDISTVVHRISRAFALVRVGIFVIDHSTLALLVCTKLARSLWKGCGEGMGKRTSPVVCLALAASLWMLPTGRAQDLYVTNLDQLVAEAYSTDHSIYLALSPLDWRAYSLDGGEPWWLDCSQISCEGLFQTPTEVSPGVPAYRVDFFQNFLTGETTIYPAGSSNAVITVPAPSGYQPVLTSWNRWLWNWYQQVVDQPDFWGLSPGEIPPPTITLRALLSDVSNHAAYADYQSNLEAAVEAASAASMSSRFMPMDDEESPGGYPCSITSLTQRFYVASITQSVNLATTITWQSCQVFRYLVYSANSLSTNTQWVPQAYVWGATNASVTSWTDMSTTNNDGHTVTQRFYRVQRLLGSPIAAGGTHSLAVTPDGKLWAWGNNSDGELSDGAEFNRPYPGEVAVPFSCFGQIVTNAVALAGGGNEFTIVADANGTVWAAGENRADEQGGAPGDYDMLGDHYPATSISSISNIVNVAAGQDHVLALCTDGTVWAWGADEDENDNPTGQLGVGGLSYPYQTSTPTQSLISATVVAIAAGAYHSVALDVSNQVWTWGQNSGGQLGNGSSGYGLATSVPMPVAGISNVIAIAAGAYHTIALTADKTVWTWGTNSVGELGRTGDNTVPGQVPNFSNVVAIAAGPDFSLAVTADGSAFSWGNNNVGQLGTNNAISSTNLPMRIPGISNVVAVSAASGDPSSQDSGAESHVVAMTLEPIDGTGQTINRFWGWGANYSGEVGAATNANVLYSPTNMQFCTRCQRCIQLGTGGSFTAQCNGSLYLYFNLDQKQSYNAAGSYTALVNGVQFAVPGNNNNASGTFVGPVTNGQVCTYSATGTCYWSRGDLTTASDPNGNGTNGTWNCFDFNIVNKTNTVCPMWQCFSLVGKIQ